MGANSGYSSLAILAFDDAAKCLSIIFGRSLQVNRRFLDRICGSPACFG